MRALLGTASHFCEAVVLKLRTVPIGAAGPSRQRRLYAAATERERDSEGERERGREREAERKTARQRQREAGPILNTTRIASHETSRLSSCLLQPRGVQGYPAHRKLPPPPRNTGGPLDMVLL